MGDERWIAVLADGSRRTIVLECYQPSPYGKPHRWVWRVTIGGCDLSRDSYSRDDALQYALECTDGPVVELLREGERTRSELLAEVERLRQAVAIAEAGLERIRRDQSARPDNAAFDTLCAMHCRMSGEDGDHG